MKKYLIDANLPYYSTIWNKEEYIHQVDLGDDWNDNRIWNYAKENGLTIITKDSDFSHRIMVKEPPPRIIHIRIGNKKIKDLFDILSPLWDKVLLMSDECKLVNVFEDRILGVK